MIIPDLKNKYSTVMSGRRSPEGEQLSGPSEMKIEDSKEEPGEPDGRHEAAQDMISAFHEKSPQKLMEAMGNFIDLHGLKKEDVQD